MEEFYFIAPLAAVIGGLIAWFSRGGFGRSVAICTPTMALIFIAWTYFTSTNRPPWYMVPAVLIYAIGPFYILAFLPSVLGVVLVLPLRQSLKNNVKHDPP